MTPDQLVDNAAFAFGVDRRAIFGDSRVAEIVKARHAVAWALRQEDWSLESIGAFLRRDHTTIIHAIKATEHRRKRNPRFAERLSIVAAPHKQPPIDWCQRITALEQRVAELERLLELHQPF